jgi:hypothetical protein
MGETDDSVSPMKRVILSGYALPTFQIPAVFNLSELPRKYFESTQKKCLKVLKFRSYFVRAYIMPSKSKNSKNLKYTIYEYEQKT